MSQQIINIGASPNDGLGNTIRDSFEICNENFTELYANSSTPYTISNGNSNVAINSANANITFGVNGTSNVAVISSNKLLVAGNVSGTYILGNGAYLTGITAESSNAGTLTGDTLSSNVVYSSLTSLGTLSNLDVAVDITAGNLSVTGNVAGHYILGNGAYLTGISGSANTGNVTFDNVNIIGTGNLKLQPDANNSGAYLDLYLTAGPDIHIAGNGENVILGTDSGSNVTVGVDGNVTIQANSGSPYTWIFDNTGTLNVPGNIDFATTSANIVAGNTLGNLSGVGDIIGLTNGIDGNGYPNYFALDGNGNLHIGQNTGISSGAITWDGGGSQIFEDIGGLVVQGYNGTVGIAGAGSDANLVVYGNITTDNLSTTGSNGNISGAYIISAEYFYGDGSNITGLAASYSNANVADYLPTYTGNLAGNNISLTGNIYADGKILNLGDSGANGIAIDGVGIVAGNNVATILYDNNIFGWAVNEGWHPAANVSYNLGRSNRYWNNLYALNINTSDVAVANSISAVGNITSGNLVTAGLVSATGNVTGNYILGNGALLTGISGGGGSNISSGTSNVTVVSSGGNVTTGIGGTGNVVVVATTGQYVTGINSASGNIIGGNILTAGLISATGNIRGNIFISNSATLTYQSAAFGWVTNSAMAPAANISYNLGTSGLWWNNFYALNVNSANTVATGIISAAGNVTGGNILTAGLISSTGNAVHGNILTAGLISATGNITSNYFFGNGSQLTGINAGSVAANALTGNTLSSNVLISSLTTVGTLGNLSVTGNTTSGNLVTAGLVSATGNISGNYFIGNGSQLTGISTGSVAANTLTGNTLSSNVLISSLTTVGTLGNLSVTGNTTSGNLLTSGLISATGNATVGNVTTAGLISATANITGGNLLTAGLISSTGNAVHGNILTAGLISATGNITASTFISSSATFNYQANVFGWATNSAIAPSSNISYNLGTSGSWWNNFYALNVNSGNTVATGIVSAVGNVYGGNVTTAGLISATANITGGNLLTSGIVSVIGNVTALGFISTGGTGTISGTGNIIGGNILTTGQISATGNATAGNVTTVGLISATGNITTAGSLISTGVAGGISGTGNIIGGNILTTGYFSATGNTYTNSVISAPVALANLTAVAGGRAFINNSNLVASGNFGALVSGGGSNVVPVWSNGTNWYIG